MLDRADLRSDNIVLSEAPLGSQHSVVQGDLLLVRDTDHLSDYLEDVARRNAEFAHLGHVYLLEVLTG